MDAWRRQNSPGPRRGRRCAHRLRSVGAVAVLLALAAGCGTGDGWEQHSVEYAVQVLGPLPSYTIQYHGAGMDSREESSRSPIWQKRVRGQFNSAMDITVQVVAEPAELPDLPDGLLPPLPTLYVSCGIAIDGHVLSSETSRGLGGLVLCSARPSELPYDALGGGSGVVPFLFAIGFVAVTVLSAMVAYARRRRPEQEEREQSGYESAPHFRLMVRCGGVGLVILSVGLLLSFSLDTPLALPRPPVLPMVRVPYPDWPTTLPGGN
ncbi:hypothetical protein [Amycolatopsis sp. NPDC098790]|uniref:hypothetical protein n=1 Tax=Amycolatopsis sp. NPDC098790 TaxID=3363939 RepID=UPI00382D29F9